MTKIKNVFSLTKQKIKAFLILSLFMTTNAYADYDIGGSDTGIFARITSFVQDIVNFIDGPVALAFSFLSIAGLAITWAVAPQAMKAMGLAVRIVIAVIIILNIGVWITALNS